MQPGESRRVAEPALLACWIAATSALLLHGTLGGGCTAADASAAGAARAAVPASSRAPA